MKYLLGLLLMIYGLLHLSGFLHAFQLAEGLHAIGPIAKPLGVLWLVATLLFLTSALFVVLERNRWYTLTVVAVLLSQLLILLDWKDFRSGTLVNAILLLIAFGTFGIRRFEKRYRADVRAAMADSPIGTEIVTETQLEGLPAPVQKHLRLAGVVGRPRVTSMRLVLEGQMREKGKKWFPFSSEQHTFFGSPTRLFFMKAKVKHLLTFGYHTYDRDRVRMQVKLLGLFPVIDLKGDVLFPTETVTFLNDLCMFAPAALLDERIFWEAIDGRTARVIFTYEDCTVSAVLHYNESGQLVNFVSNDRYAIDDMKAYPFSTPVSRYSDFNGFQLPGYGEAIWDYPEGPFTYGKFSVKEVVYNPDCHTE